MNNQDSSIEVNTKEISENQLTRQGVMNKPLLVALGLFLLSHYIPLLEIMGQSIRLADDGSTGLGFIWLLVLAMAAAFGSGYNRALAILLGALFYLHTYQMAAQLYELRPMLDMLNLSPRKNIAWQLVSKVLSTGFYIYSASLISILVLVWFYRGRQNDSLSTSAVQLYQRLKTLTLALVNFIQHKRNQLSQEKSGDHAKRWMNEASQFAAKHQLAEKLNTATSQAKAFAEKHQLADKVSAATDHAKAFADKHHIADKATDWAKPVLQNTKTKSSVLIVIAVGSAAIGLLWLGISAVFSSSSFDADELTELGAASFAQSEGMYSDFLVHKVEHCDSEGTDVVCAIDASVQSTLGSLLSGKRSKVKELVLSETEDGWAVTGLTICEVTGCMKI